MFKFIGIYWIQTKKAYITYGDYIWQKTSFGHHKHMTFSESKTITCVLSDELLVKPSLLLPSNAIKHHGILSTLAQIMACWLMASTNYLN